MDIRRNYRPPALAQRDLRRAVLKQLLQPTLNRQTHLVEVSLEEVIARNKHQLFRLGGSGNDFLHRLMRSKLVMIAAQEELRLAALCQKLVRIQPALCLYRCSQRDERVDIRIRTTRPQAPCRTKRESGEEDGQVELLFQPS